MKKLYLAVCILSCFSFISPAFGDGLKFEAELSGAQETAD